MHYLCLSCTALFPTHSTPNTDFALLMLSRIWINEKTVTSSATRERTMSAVMGKLCATVPSSSALLEAPGWHYHIKRPVWAYSRLCYHPYKSAEDKLCKSPYTTSKKDNINQNIWCLESAALEMRLQSQVVGEYKMNWLNMTYDKQTHH